MLQLDHRKSPLLRVVGAVIGALALLAALTVGAVVFVAAIGVAAVALAVFYFRLRWRLRQRPGDPSATASSAPSGGGQVIEGEYRVEAQQTSRVQR